MTRSQVASSVSNNSGEMTHDESTLRRRRPSSPSVESSSPEPSSKPMPTPRQTRTARFYVVWAARILLPFVFLLSTAKPVIIETSQSILHEQPSPDAIPQTTAVLLITHSRPDYLTRALNSLISNHPNNSHWPIVVSQDMQDQEHTSVTDVIQSFAAKAATRNMSFYHRRHAKSYDEQIENATFIDTAAYRRISRHYYNAIAQLFSKGLQGTSVERLIIIEDDMEIAPDFFSYFQALTPLLESDETLFCISAWNDNGIQSLSLNNEQLHRTDFFPGLGWMLTRNIWEELAGKWPEQFWDDWLRHPDQTRGRQCIRPEISRTGNFGAKGVSQSFHYEKHVSKVAMATEAVDFAILDLSYLDPNIYHDMIFSRMSNAVALRYSNYLTSRPQDSDVIAFYPEGGLEAIGKRTGIMIDHRNGIRRTSYKGVVIIPWNGHWAFIVQRGWEAPEGYTLGSSECC